MLKSMASCSCCRARVHNTSRRANLQPPRPRRPGIRIGTKFRIYSIGQIRDDCGQSADAERSFANPAVVAAGQLRAGRARADRLRPAGQRRAAARARRRVPAQRPEPDARAEPPLVPRPGHGARRAPARRQGRVVPQPRAAHAAARARAATRAAGAARQRQQRRARVPRAALAQPRRAGPAVRASRADLSTLGACDFGGAAAHEHDRASEDRSGDRRAAVVRLRLRAAVPDAITASAPTASWSSRARSSCRRRR